jgi:hypothetical protein
VQLGEINFFLFLGRKTIQGIGNKNFFSLKILKKKVLLEDPETLKIKSTCDL